MIPHHLLLDYTNIGIGRCIASVEVNQKLVRTHPTGWKQILHSTLHKSARLSLSPSSFTANARRRRRAFVGGCTCGSFRIGVMVSDGLTVRVVDSTMMMLDACCLCCCCCRFCCCSRRCCFIWSNLAGAADGSGCCWLTVVGIGVVVTCAMGFLVFVGADDWSICGDVFDLLLLLVYKSKTTTWTNLEDMIQTISIRFIKIRNINIIGRTNGYKAIKKIWQNESSVQNLFQVIDAIFDSVHPVLSSQVVLRQIYKYNKVYVIRF